MGAVTAISRDYVRGLNDACQVLLLETQVWRDMANEKSREHNNRVVCAAIWNAMAELLERMLAGIEKATADLERVVVEQKVPS